LTLLGFAATHIKNQKEGPAICMVSPHIPVTGEYKISFLIKKASSKYTCVGVASQSVSLNGLLGH